MRTLSLLLGLALAGCAGGGVGINLPATMVLIAPDVDVVGEAGLLLEVRYTDDDPDGTALTDLFADRDGDLSTSGDQVAIALGRPDRDGAVQTVSWDTTGVAPGAYTIVVRTDDGTNPPVVRTAPGRVTLQIGAPPTASILFPPPGGATDSDRVTVRGTAADASGVAAVRVNGVAASSDNGFANWSVEVPVAPGTNAITVETEDVHGILDVNTAGLSLLRTTPLNGPFVAQAIDAAHDRLLGTSLGPWWSNTKVIGLDPSTGIGTVIADPADPFIHRIAVDAASNRAYFLLGKGGGQLVAMDLDSGAVTQASGSSVGTGPAFSLSGALALDPANGFAYVSTLRKGFVAVNLATGDRTLVVGAPLFGEMVLDATAGRLLGFLFRSVELESFDLATGDTTIIAKPAGDPGPDFLFPEGIALDAANNRALVSDRDLAAVIAVDLATGSRTILSDSATGLGVQLTRPSTLTLDEANGRLFVNDSPHVIAIDLATGDRTVLATQGFPGAGVDIGRPGALALDTSSERILVVDTAKAALVAFDRVTGLRTVLSDATTGNGPALQDPFGVALDSAATRALVMDRGLGALIEVNLASGDRAVISDAARGTGPMPLLPNGIALDAANDRALVADEDLGGILAIDLTTGNRTILADASTGRGLTFSSIMDVAIDADRGRLAVVDSDRVGLMAVDAVTGDRSVISGPFEGTGPFLESPLAVALDPAADAAYVIDDSLEAVMRIDLATGDRTVISDETLGNGPPLLFPMDIELDLARQVALITDQGYEGLVAVDLSSGDRVLISRSPK